MSDPQHPSDAPDAQDPWAPAPPVPPPPPTGSFPPPPSPPTAGPGDPAGPAAPGAAPEPPAWSGSSPEGVIEISTTTGTVTKGRGGRVAAGVVGVGLLVGGSLFAVTQLSGSGGGAASPEAAVQTMLDAIESEDVIGVLESLTPAERALVMEPAQQASEELARIGVVPEDFTLDGIDGVDLEFEGVELVSDPVRDGLAMVSVVGGQGTITVDPDQVPIGPLVEDLAEEWGEPLEITPVSETADLADEDMTVAAVEVDGGWYVSFGYTIAETARVEAGAPVPNPAEAVTPNGGGSPEEAVQNAVDAMTALDLEAAIGTLPPDLYAPLYEYAPLFLPEAQGALDEMAAEEDIEIAVDSLDLASDTDGDRAEVSITGFALSASADGEDISVSWDGECFSASGSAVDGDEELCPGDAAADLETLPFGQDLFEELSESATTSLVTVRVDGQWYVEPASTVLDGVVTVLSAIDGDDIRELVDGMFGFAEDLGSEFEEEFEGVGEPVDPLEPPVAGEGSPTTTVPGDESGFLEVDPDQELAPGITAAALATRFVEAFGADQWTGECLAEEYALNVDRDPALIARLYEAALQDEEPEATVLDPFLEASDACGF